MKKTIEDIDVRNKRVLVRCDFNVPQNENGEITDNRRIVGALPTIQYLIKEGAMVILCSHLGRPKGEYNLKYTLEPIKNELSRLLGKEVIFSHDVIGEETQNKVANMKNGDVLLIENVRFHKEEEENDEEFAKKLASFADVYVNDAFGTAHRAHASTEGVAKYLPAVSGFLIKKELDYLGNALELPQRPFVAILGGAKVSDKINVIENLLTKVDALIIGGAMAYTFLKAEGYQIGASLCEDDKLDLAKEILEKAKKQEVKILLPVDHIVAKDADSDEIFIMQEIPENLKGFDIGAETIKLYEEELNNAKTIVWNGPLGMFEKEQFANGTMSIARKLADLKSITIIGGGDSALAIEQAGVADKMSHISTGGGASLEFLEGKTLPGIACLENK